MEAHKSAPEKPKPKLTAKQWLISVLIAAALLMVAVICQAIEGPAKCPDAQDEFDVDIDVRREIDEAIKTKLLSPSSYQRESMSSIMAFAEKRPDGTEYFRRLSVRFTAENAFGVRLRRDAVVDLTEDEESGACRVVSAALKE